MSSIRSSRRNKLDWTHVITALITAISSILVTLLTIQGNTDNVRRDLQATITALQTQATLTTNPQIVEVTPTPDSSVLILTSIPGRVFAFTGDTNATIKSSAALSINYPDTNSTEYILNYSLPDQDFTWAGIATQYYTATNISSYNILEIKVKSSNNDVAFQIKMVDKTNDEVYLDITNPPSQGVGITITAQSDGQLIRIPLRGNFDKLNFEQIVEITFITNSGLSSGTNSLHFSRIVALK